MTPKYIKWALFLVPALVIGGFETIRHTLLENVLPMELGNWVTAIIDAAVIAVVSRTLFQQFARTEKELSKEKESRAILEERERLSRALHDQIAQSIFYSGVQVNAAQTKAVQYDDKELQVQLGDVLLSLREIDENVRQAIFNLKHKTIDGGNLEERIRSYLDKTLSTSRITWEVSFPEQPVVLSPSEQVQLFGILQEAVTNIIKHANATQVHVRFETGTSDKWNFQIYDNGIGFDIQSVGGRRYGLDIISNRARDIDAELMVESSNKGTMVAIRRL
ncbi:sensor histidine kinase [Alicyclobacillus dauci]|uniref:histidine kinase n=1 Tax=Alicyclobacillus dauci TaxID=1475485 RepID=A0ABY6Z379_9BACL|nr:histidine kinase [Alicyclobacillus dauci]WAH36425.1 histidine kinase [Alicyclobacillus dauci]